MFKFYTLGRYLRLNDAGKIATHCNTLQHTATYTATHTETLMYI